MSEILQYNNFNQEADESARSSMVNTPHQYLTKVSSATPSTLTMSQIKSGFERKASKSTEAKQSTIKRAQSSCSTNTQNNKKKSVP